ncbi:MXAN_5187 C-terminal domain-containing protein [candidate division CSSED10-310 bacterium]|uniref:MXAN_5187 C-terminal domain-containing protein n=1 Tax=candidate division CSSED10-310 bacterium TaxID=2855610 RepID=A0ABV6YU79_UNCC1
MGIPEDLVLLEKNIEKLKFEYDQYFQGVIKIPPHTIKAAVDRLIRKYQSTQISNSALRFRYQNLVYRYNSLGELWNRRLRMKEEGIMIGAPQRVASYFQAPPVTPEPDPKAPKTKKDQKKPRPKVAAKKEFTATTRDPHQETEIVSAIYKQYMKAQSDSGQPVKRVSQDGFQKLIAKQVAAIKKSHKCSAVNFSVKIHDGEVKLKAKPVK